jgi:hypothetical protein
LDWQRDVLKWDEFMPSAVTSSGQNGSMPTDEQKDVLGASRSLIMNEWDWPVHGLRHPPSGGTSGWYVWTGELSKEDDFFRPWHASHLVERCPELGHLLDLPPGTRFLVAPGYEDIWEDPSLLDI